MTTAPATAPTIAALSGRYTIDPSHTEIGFVARHAMVTKVRGAFTEFEGSATTRPGLADAAIALTIQASSVDTGNADRDGHLRSADFFDVETHPTITFVSTHIAEAAPHVLHVEGLLTMRGVTRPVAIDFDFDGAATDPFGNERVGLSGSVVVNRKDFGLEWNAALETGGVLVSENVTLVFEVSAIRSGDAPEAAPVEDEQPAPARASAPAAQAQPAAQGGFVAWLKKIFA